jgi:hypothetical protein
MDNVDELIKSNLLKEMFPNLSSEGVPETF